jgi:hypothetical protein
MSVVRWKIIPLMVAILTAGSLGCDGDPASVGRNATVRVLLTDAAADYIGEAFVDIGQVQIIPAGEGGPITLSEDGTDGMVDLMQLQGEATSLLAEGVVDPGTYHQLRLIVEGARVVLAEKNDHQYVFTDGKPDQDMKVPSGAQTGIKLNLKPAAPSDPESGQEDEGGVYIAQGKTVLILDFDVGRSFVIQGNPETPAGIKSVHFKPTLRVIVEDGAGSISGTVSTAVSDFSVKDLLVTATPEENTFFGEYQTQAAEFKITSDDGKYTIPFLVPGTYTVSVTLPTGYVTDPANAVVEVGEGEDVGDINFTINAAGPE